MSRPARRTERAPALTGAAAVGLLLGATLIPGRAAAESLGPEVLLQQTTMVMNQQSNVYSFTTPGPGTLMVQFSDTDWPTALQNVNLSIDSPSKVLGSLAVMGGLDLALAGAGTYYSDITAQAGGSLDVGVYSLQVEFLPQGATVPLPAALGLLLGGLAVLGGVQLVNIRMRNESVTSAA